MDGYDPTTGPPELSPIVTMVDNVQALVAAGGPVVMVLLGMSIMALTIVLVKMWQFHAAAIGKTRAVAQAVSLHRSGRTDDALAVLRTAPGVMASVVGCALRGIGGQVPDAEVREEVMRLGTDMLERLRSWLRPLEVIAALAPLLGQFGTVLGMIEAFQQLEQAGSQVDPSILSGGIWQALLTTAVGLGVAMPVVVALNWLERRVDRLAHEMDTTVTQVFTRDLAGPISQTQQSHGRPVPAVAF